MFANRTGGPSNPPPCNATTPTSATSPRFHDLRHTCATLLLEQVIDLVTIKDLLGHAQIHTTADVYSHVRLRIQRAAIESMGDALDDDSDPDPDENSDDPTRD